jgi:hypothetical protein
MNSKLAIGGALIALGVSGGILIASHGPDEPLLSCQTRARDGHVVDLGVKTTTDCLLAADAFSRGR